jgi:hypothetical protein
VAARLPFGALRIEEHHVAAQLGQRRRVAERERLSEEPPRTVRALLRERGLGGAGQRLHHLANAVSGFDARCNAVLTCRRWCAYH